MAGRGAAAGLAFAAVALTAAGCGAGTATTVTVTRTHTVTTTQTVTTKTRTSATPCTGAQLSGTFALVPGSAGAGHVEYVLTLHNTSQTSCSLHGVPNATLLATGGSQLPTDIVRNNGGGKLVVLAPGASAKAAARFSPDVPGPGDQQTGACQPKAYVLEITLTGGGTTNAAIQPPTSVCEQGQLQFQPFSSA